MPNNVTAPFIVYIWPLLNSIILIAFIVATILFVRYIYVKLKKIDEIEKLLLGLMETQKRNSNEDKSTPLV